MQRPRRAGMVIPMVILCLIVMAILGVVLVSNATSQYMATAKVAYGLKMREVALAGLEEATALAYDRLNRPVAAGQPAPAWHAELLEAIRRSGNAPQGVLVRHDLKGEGLLPRTAAIASAEQCEIASASVELLAFKRLSIDSRGLFEDPKVYYHDPDQKLDAVNDPKLEPVKEWVGSMRVRVTARSERFTRTMSKVADVKVVDVSPVAREFVLFSYLSASRDQTGGPESDDYYQNDMRRGGPVKLFAHGEGRIFVRGPFLVDTVGYTNGEGGKRPPRTTSFTPTAENEWWGWHQVPSTHDGIMTRAGVAVVNFAMPPMRPDTRDDWRLFKGLVTERFGSSFADWFSDDPGYYILNGQRWYCESTSNDSNMLSIAGDPANGRPEPFRGVLALYENGRRLPQGPSTPLHQGAGLAKPSDENKRWVVEPEGGLHGIYNVVEYYGDTILGGTYQEYELTRKGQVIGRLGLHWEKCYELGWFNQFVIDLIGGGTIFGAFGVLPRLLMTRGVAEAMATVLTSWVGMDWRQNTPTSFNGITPDALVNAFPPGYRPPGRAQTRRYPSLKTLVARQGQRPVLLDGILGFDDLSCDVPIPYQGRGMFYSEQQSAPTLTAPISPATAGDAASYLTVHHEAPVVRAHRGGAMLGIRAANGGRTVNAAVYATQGVKPSGGITINGNLTCGYLNKGQVSGGSSLEVSYRPPAATGLISAVSPRTAACLDR